MIDMNVYHEPSYSTFTYIYACFIYMGKCISLLIFFYLRP